MKDLHAYRHFIVGRGRLGGTIHRSLSAAGRTAESLHTADVIWICVPDDAIPQVAGDIAQTARSHACVIHTSGHLTSQSVAVRDDLVCGSLHPAYPFPQPMDQMPANILWSFEGDDALFSIAEEMVTFWSGMLVRISGDQKVAYHTACVLLANLAAVPGLVAQRLVKDMDLPWPLMIDGLLVPLVDRLRSGELPAALTGPAARGDRRTIQEQCQWLEHCHPEDRVVYEVLTNWILSHRSE